MPTTLRAPPTLPSYMHVHNEKAHVCDTHVGKLYKRVNSISLVYNILVENARNILEKWKQKF